jgi:alpha-beta hydrolase superfamily lysophospholipase
MKHHTLFDRLSVLIVSEVRSVLGQRVRTSETEHRAALMARPTFRQPAFLLLVTAWLLSSCAPTLREAGPAVGPAQLIDDQAFVTADGTRLPLRAWLPAADPRGIILALHGFNDYSEAFDGPGKALAKSGLAVFAYDQRGFGAGPHPGYWAGTDTLSTDLMDAVTLLSARYPGKPLYLLGESMGGAVAMVTMARPDAPAVAGLILSAPAVWGRASMPWYQRTALAVASYTVPWLTLTGRGLNIRPSDNIEMLRRLSRDPLVIKETRVDAIHGLCDLMDAAAAIGPERLSPPTLVLYGDKDEVIPSEPTLAVMARLANQPGHRVTGAFYLNGYHMLLRDLDADVVLTDIAAWTSQPNAPLPSGADRHAREVLAAQRPIAQSVVQ